MFGGLMAGAENGSEAGALPLPPGTHEGSSGEQGEQEETSIAPV